MKNNSLSMFLVFLYITLYSLGYAVRIYSGRYVTKAGVYK